MALLKIEDESLIRRLQARAVQEKKSVEAVITELLDKASEHEAGTLIPIQVDDAEADRAFKSLAGMFDAEIPAELLSVREAIANYYRTHDDSTD